MPTLAVLVPTSGAAPPPHPATLPMGRAALHLADVGIEVVFAHLARAGSVSGLRATVDGWVALDAVPVAGAYDRYPAKGDPAGHATLLAGLIGLPVANPPRLTALCRDKLACQHHLEARGIPMPEVVADPAAFREALDRWGAAFLKPRYGAFGAGVCRVEPGAPLAAQVASDRGAPEAALLQRAVAPPAGYAGVSARALAQRLADGSWTVAHAVARRARHDPVVNVSRGAEVRLAVEVLAPETIDALTRLTLAVADALCDHPDGAHLAELGVDLAIDRGGAPWVIEVNGRPRGRLEVLAAADPARFGAAHLEACARPLRFLAATAGGG